MSDLDRMLEATIKELPIEEQLEQVKLILEQNEFYKKNHFGKKLLLDFEYAPEMEGLKPVKFSYYSTAAAAAAIRGNLSVVITLVEYGYAPYPAFYMAAFCGHKDIVRYFLTHDLDPNHTLDRPILAKTTPFIMAQHVDETTKSLGLFHAYFSLKKALGASLKLAPSVKKRTQNQKQKTNNNDTQPKSGKESPAAKSWSIDRFGFVINNLETKDNQTTKSDPAVSYKTIVATFNEAWAFDCELVIHYLAKCLQEIAKSKLNPNDPLLKRELDYPLLVKFTEILFTAIADEDYPDEDAYTIFVDVLLPEWSGYEPGRDSIYFAPDSLDENGKVISERRNYLKRWFKGKPPENNFTWSLEPLVTTDTASLDSDIKSETKEQKRPSSLFSSPLLGSPVHAGQTMTRSVDAVPTDAFQRESKSIHTPVKVNFFEAFQNLPLEVQRQKLAEHNDFNIHQIETSIMIMLESMDIDPTLVCFCNAGPGVPNERWELYDQKLHGIIKDNKHRYAAFIAQSNGGTHAVAGLFVKNIKLKFAVDPERDRNGGQTEIEKQIAEAFNIIDNLREFKDATLPLPTPENTPQGPSDTTNCGFWAGIIILGIIATLENKFPQSDNPEVNRIVQACLSLNIDPKKGTLGKLPQTQDLHAIKGALILAYDAHLLKVQETQHHRRMLAS